MKLPREIKTAVNQAKKRWAKANGVLKWYVLEQFEIKLAKNKRVTSSRKKNEYRANIE